MTPANKNPRAGANSRGLSNHDTLYARLDADGARRGLRPARAGDV